MIDQGYCMFSLHCFFGAANRGNRTGQSEADEDLFSGVCKVRLFDAGHL